VRIAREYVFCGRIYHRSGTARADFASLTLGDIRMSLIQELTQDVIVDTNNEASVIKPGFLSHGTMECRDLRETRPFYEQFLGLECVQHGRRSMAVRCGLKFHIVCLQLHPDETPHPLGTNNHWGLDLRSRLDVDAAHRAALEHKDRFKIRQVTDPVDAHGVYSFYVEDLDSNWWEFQYYEAGLQNDDLFEFGDRFNPDGTSIA
jgi:catechol 2,3-dioxygenase-like lactoylglutathione lyase family enzyme